MAYCSGINTSVGRDVCSNASRPSCIVSLTAARFQPNLDGYILVNIPYIKSRENRFSVSGVVSRKWTGKQSGFIEWAGIHLQPLHKIWFFT